MDVTGDVKKNICVASRPPQAGLMGQTPVILGGVTSFGVKIHLEHALNTLHLRHIRVICTVTNVIFGDVMLHC